MRSSKFLFIAASFLLSAFFSTAALAQIKTDGSVGPAAQSLSAVSGQFTIPQKLGRLSGSNLFHSFKDFNINTGESATFTTSSTGISNVISRVTGGNVSNINGTLALRAADGTPAFWFINPAGVAFGQGASIDVPGAFHVSTAHYIKFPDGKLYSDTQNVSTFSSAPPEAFGFLGTTRASIEVTAGAKLNNGDHTLNLIAGDITIDGSEVLNAAGAMNLVAMGTAIGEVSTSGVTSQAASGMVKVVNDSWVGSLNSNDVNASPVTITAGNLLVDNSLLATKTVGSGQGGDLRIQVADTMSVLNDSYVASKSGGPGDAGNVAIGTASLVMDNSLITSYNWGSGNGGSVNIQVTGEMKISNHTFVGSENEGPSRTGNVNVTANTIQADDSFIASGNWDAGPGGTVTVKAAGEIKLSNYSYLGSQSGSDGNAGHVSVNAASLIIDASRLTSLSFGSGNSGNVNVQVSGPISILSGGYISADSYSTGNAGQVSVRANSLLINPKDSSEYTFISSDSLFEDNSSVGGNAGTITVQVAGRIDLLNGGQISTQTYSTLGKGGSIDVKAAQINIDGYADHVCRCGEEWLMYSGITASAKIGSSGQPGSVAVSASESINIQNQGEIAIRNDATVAAPSTLAATTLSVNAPSIFLNSGGKITTESTGNVAASNIALKFTDKLAINPTTAITTTALDGNGGSIDISGKGLLMLDRASITTSVTGASGDAGSIKIDTKTLLMTNGFIQANTSAPLASGGTIQIGAEALVSSFGTLLVGGSSPYAFDAVTPGFNVIQAASPTGVSGDIAITTPNLDLAGKLAGLKVNLLVSGGFSRNPCLGSGSSSFAVTGRGGLPVSSFGALASSSVKIETQNASQVEPFNFAAPQTTFASAQLGCRSS